MRMNAVVRFDWEAKEAAVSPALYANDEHRAARGKATLGTADN